MRTSALRLSPAASSSSSQAPAWRPERCEDHARRLGKRDTIIDPPHWQHAYRAARSMHELDRIGQHGLDPELEDCMRVAAAYSMSESGDGGRYRSLR